MKSLNTVESIGQELDSLYEQVETGDMDGDDSRELNMKLRILAQRADLLKNHALEAKLESIEKLVEQRLAPHLKRVV